MKKKKAKAKRFSDAAVLEDQFLAILTDLSSDLTAGVRIALKKAEVRLLRLGVK